MLCSLLELNHLNYCMSFWAGLPVCSVETERDFCLMRKQTSPSHKITLENKVSQRPDIRWPLFETQGLEVTSA